MVFVLHYNSLHDSCEQIIIRRQRKVFNLSNSRMIHKINDIQKKEFNTKLMRNVASTKYFCQIETTCIDR